MSKVAIITDSVSLLTPEIAETYGITVVSTHITMDGKDYLDIDMNLSEFYAQLPQLREAEKFPTTSSPSISDYLEIYRELAKKVKSILCVTYSPRLGMAYNAATQAKEMLRGELDKVTIEIINSGTCCGAQMLIALEAAKATAKGKRLAEITEMANNMVTQVRQIYIVEDLYYLAKGGRIGKARHWASSTISTKSLLGLDASTGGVIVPLTRAKTKTKLMEKMLGIVKERSGNKKLHAIINHANVPDEAEELKKRLLSRFDCAELYITPVLPLLAIHNGPGCIWLAWYGGD
ncbi:MAG: DegV family protein [Dehalococcoidia bacterium]|nr:DegV family protein [Dehalococcoidia bacterium]